MIGGGWRRRPISWPSDKPWMGYYAGVSGVTTGTQLLANFRLFEEFVGYELPLALCFADQTSWSNFGSFASFLFDTAADYGRYNKVVAAGKRMMISVPLNQPGGSTLADVAAGTYDSYFISFFTGLKNRGIFNPYIRLGWEFNSGGYAHALRDGGLAGVNGTTAQAVAMFLGAWNRVVLIIRSILPAAEIIWNPLKGGGGLSDAQMAACHPALNMFDHYGIDLYNDNVLATSDTDQVARWLDENWGAGGSHPVAYGLKWISDLCDLNGKRLFLCEWATTYKQGNANAGISDSGGGDDGVFVSNVGDFINTAKMPDGITNKVVGHVYWMSNSNVFGRLDASSGWRGVVPSDLRNEKNAALAAFRSHFCREAA